MKIEVRQPAKDLSNESTSYKIMYHIGQVLGFCFAVLAGAIITIGSFIFLLLLLFGLPMIIIWGIVEIVKSF